MRAVILTAMVAAVPLACGDPADREVHGGDTTAATPREPAPAISIEHARDFDLTGDTLQETVRVTATGNRYDSLAVRLAVRARDGTPLYVDRWNSRLYFIYEDRAEVSDAEVLRRVRGRLQRIVHDSAYFDPRAGRPRPLMFQVDSETVAYSVAEKNWRDRNALPDTAVLPLAALSEITGADARGDRVARLVTELLRQPAFAYYAGGEANYTIAWSPSERRFFTIWACC